jgi:hypothetical protein
LWGNAPEKVPEGLALPSARKRPQKAKKKERMPKLLISINILSFFFKGGRGSHKPERHKPESQPDLSKVKARVKG